MVTLIFLRGLCGYVWVDILTLSPPRDYTRNDQQIVPTSVYLPTARNWYLLTSQTWPPFPNKARFSVQSRPHLPVLPTLDTTAPAQPRHGNSIHQHHCFEGGQIHHPWNVEVWKKEHSMLFNDAWLSGKKSLSSVTPDLSKDMQCHAWLYTLFKACRSPEQTSGHS